MSNIVSELKCRHFFINQNYDPNSNESRIHFYERQIPDQARHGDMLIGGAKDLRSMNVFYVNVESMTKKLCQKDPSGSGYTCVPLEISKKIPDPIKFYENSFSFNGYSEMDFLGIEIDTRAHQDFIKKATGGRNVNDNKQVFYFLDDNEWEAGKGINSYVIFILDF